MGGTLTVFLGSHAAQPSVQASRRPGDTEGTASCSCAPPTGTTLCLAGREQGPVPGLASLCGVDRLLAEMECVPPKHLSLLLNAD